MEINQIFEGIAKELQESCSKQRKQDFNQKLKGMNKEELKAACYYIYADIVAYLLNCDIEQVPDIDIECYKKGKRLSGDENYTGMTMKDILEIDNTNAADEEVRKELKKFANLIVNDYDLPDSWRAIAKECI